MNDVLNDKAWLEKIMYIIKINQWDNRFGTSNLFFSTSRMLTFYTAGKVHKPITTRVQYIRDKSNRGNLFANLNFKS